MQMLEVYGGRRLSGEIPVQGAKNSVLPILAATVLAEGQSVLHNCPILQDVETAVEILRHLGCRVERDGHTLTVDATGVNRWDVPRQLMLKMRSSVMFLGAILTRTGQADLYPPGGCELGARPIDLHLRALLSLGAAVEVDGEHICCRKNYMCGGTVLLPFPSVGATENAILAALGCREPVVIVGAAREPEIADLAGFLQAMGAQIFGAGTGEIRILPGEKLHGAEYRIMPDRIVAATLLCAVTAAGGDVTLTDVVPDQVSAVSQVLRRTGAAITVAENRLRIVRNRPLRSAGRIETAPYPGFPTDAQAPCMAAVLTAHGTTRFQETIFDNRLRHAYQMQKLGAEILISGCTAAVTGVPELHGAELQGGDLRGTAALTVAALTAEGRSTVFGLEHLDRGYEHLERQLSNLGAAVTRCSEENK